MMLLKDLALMGRQQISSLILKPTRCIGQKLVTSWNESIKSVAESGTKRHFATSVGTRTQFIIGNYTSSTSYTMGLRLDNNIAPGSSTVMRSFGYWNMAKKPILGASTQQVRMFHAKGSKVQYLDFRYKFNTNKLRSHLLIIRRQKMKKHRRKKWRKKFKTVLAKMRLKREIAKEKTFRVELLTMIKRAENFDPREYALRKIQEVNNRPVEKTREERLEELKELIRQNRYQVDYIKPKHRRSDTM